MPKHPAPTVRGGTRKLRRQLGKRRGRGKKTYYWDGIQVPLTSLSSSAVVEVVGTGSTEFKPSTLVRIRGHICFVSTATSGTTVAAKILYVELNDAGAMTGDHAAIDTHEEDIAARQLWTYYRPLRGATAGQPDDVAFAEVDVKAKLRLESHGKKSVVLLLEGSSGANASFTVNLRALLMNH